MNFGSKYLPLRTVIIMLVCSVVIIALVITGVLLINASTESIEHHQGEKAMSIAQTVSITPLVIEALEKNQRGRDVQSFTRNIQQETNMLFIVVMDMNGIRLSHPDPSRIGKRFIGGDEKEVLKGKKYTSTAEGTLGPSLRAFHPVFNESGKQIGAVSVGISLQSVNEAANKRKKIIFTGMGAGIVIGMIGAIILAANINRILFGLEPAAIASLLQERNAMLESVREGIIAVNNKAEIVVANAEAIKIFQKAGLDPDPIGKKADEYLPKSRLVRILQSPKAEYDQESDINGLPILVNRVPIILNGKLAGAISTFRDKTEMKLLAEQLTGIKTYADALRAQTHEFMNTLHVITGMVHMKEYKELESYLRKQTKLYQTESSSIGHIVKDPVIAGFLLSKRSYARENKVKLNLEVTRPLPASNNHEMTHHIITILGNLIENAFDAVKEKHEKRVDITIEYNGFACTITVKDNGEGIPLEIRNLLFDQTVSTKGANHGYGLLNVKKSVQSLSGKISFHTSNEGTVFKVVFPYREERSE
ncbi:DcuS/MalK family sensor histidine kinase [Siminovitchia sp. FSL H7-0308]|uniref:DcuS/MalK family sensor histidine kinase n=1 Tax=Siminovitchia sp. FSL H7-0308 TaxID=2921432 RepID=UPI0030EF314E